MQQHLSTPAPRLASGLPMILAGALALLGSSCASTKTGASAQTRAIESIPDVEALPPDARPVIKVSVETDGDFKVPAEYAWLYALGSRGNDSSVASGANMETKIIDALVATNRFHVRTNDFDDLQQEKALEASGDLREDSAVRRGNVLKAQYAIRCKVTDLNYGEEEAGSSVGGWTNLPGVRYFKLGKNERMATVKITAQIVNIETGVIVQSVQGEGFQTSSSADRAFNVKGITLSQNEKKDPTLANAISECIKELVFEVSESIPANSNSAP